MQLAKLILIIRGSVIPRTDVSKPSIVSFQLEWKRYESLVKDRWVTFASMGARSIGRGKTIRKERMYFPWGKQRVQRWVKVKEGRYRGGGTLMERASIHICPSTYSRSAIDRYIDGPSSPVYLRRMLKGVVNYV